MRNALKWFAGFAVLIINPISDVCSQESNCVHESETYINCYNQRLTKIPPGTEKIKVLNISSNPKIKNLDANALKSYSHLKELSMTNLRDWNIPADFLTPLTELEVLDISGTNFDSTLKFPPSIKILVADALGLQSGALSSYDFSYLVELNAISLRSNGITQLPNLNKSAPIYFMDISENPITDIDQFQLAQLCQLLRIDMSLEKSSVESCCCVMVWLLEFEVETNLRCSQNNEECTQDKYPLNETALLLFEKCYENVMLDEKSGWSALILNVILIIGIFLAFVFLVFKYFLSRDVQGEEQGVREEGVTEEENVEME